jgi:hypothetical protein
MFPFGANLVLRHTPDMRILNQEEQARGREGTGEIREEDRGRVEVDTTCAGVMR